MRLLIAKYRSSKQYDETRSKVSRQETLAEVQAVQEQEKPYEEGRICIWAGQNQLNAVTLENP